MVSTPIIGVNQFVSTVSGHPSFRLCGVYLELHPQNFWPPKSRISKFSREGPPDHLFPRRKDARVQRKKGGRNGLAEGALAYFQFGHLSHAPLWPAKKSCIGQKCKILCAHVQKPSSYRLDRWRLCTCTLCWMLRPIRALPLGHTGGLLFSHFTFFAIGVLIRLFGLSLLHAILCFFTVLSVGLIKSRSMTSHRRSAMFIRQTSVVGRCFGWLKQTVIW